MLATLTSTPHTRLSSRFFAYSASYRERLTPLGAYRHHDDGQKGLLGNLRWDQRRQQPSRILLCENGRPYHVLRSERNEEKRKCKHGEGIAPG